MRFRGMARKPAASRSRLPRACRLPTSHDVIVRMEELQHHGVGFAMDDFGTGYSSLTYLKRLPLDVLEIDQSFVRDVLVDTNDAAIANMIVALANSMGLSVIAEGVETVEQMQHLARHGCHAYQGYLFSRPVPVERFETLGGLFRGRCNRPKRSRRRSNPAIEAPHADGTPHRARGHHRSSPENTLAGPIGR